MRGTILIVVLAVGLAGLVGCEATNQASKAPSQSAIAAAAAAYDVMYLTSEPTPAPEPQPDPEPDGNPGGNAFEAIGFTLGQVSTAAAMTLLSQVEYCPDGQCPIRNRATAPRPTFSGEMYAPQAAPALPSYAPAPPPVAYRYSVASEPTYRSYRRAPVRNFFRRVFFRRCR